MNKIAIPIPIAFSTDFVIANVGHKPRTETNIDFFQYSFVKFCNFVILNT